MMPKIDGIQVIKILKDNQITSNIPVIIITSSPIFESKQYCMNLGAVGYLVKPITKEAINLLLEKHLT